MFRLCKAWFARTSFRGRHQKGEERREINPHQQSKARNPIFQARDRNLGTRICIEAEMAWVLSETFGSRHAESRRWSYSTITMAFPPGTRCEMRIGGLREKL